MEIRLVQPSHELRLSGYNSAYGNEEELLLKAGTCRYKLLVWGIGMLSLLFTGTWMFDSSPLEVAYKSWKSLSSV